MDWLSWWHWFQKTYVHMFYNFITNFRQTRNYISNIYLIVDLRPMSCVWWCKIHIVLWFFFFVSCVPNVWQFNWIVLYDWSLCFANVFCWHVHLLIFFDFVAEVDIFYWRKKDNLYFKVAAYDIIIAYKCERMHNHFNRPSDVSTHIPKWYEVVQNIV